MYSMELYPDLAPVSHSAHALEKVDRPIARLVTPPTYRGLNEEVNRARIQYLSCISPKTQIYAIGLVQQGIPLIF